MHFECLLLQEQEPLAEQGRELRWDASAFVWQETVEMLGTQGTDVPALQVTALGLLPSDHFLSRSITQTEACLIYCTEHGGGPVWVGAIALTCSMQGGMVSKACNHDAELCKHFG